LVLEGMMAETLALHGMVTSVPFPRLKQLVEDYERRLILAALARTRGNQRRAAAELGCLPTTLNEKMRRLGMRACDRPSEDGGESPVENEGADSAETV
jgi:DNA-binding NtrC family response regulator